MKRQLILVLAMVLLLAAGTALANPTDGLIAYYPFNGNANDEAGNGYDGTVYSATLTADRFGNPSSAYSFDGVDDYISLSNPGDLMFTDSFSVSLWALVAENTDTYDPLIWFGPADRSSHFTISRDRLGNEGGPFYTQTSGLGAYWVQSSLEGDDVIGSWFHLTAVVDRDAETLSFYVAGQYEGSAPLTSFDLTTTTPAVNIGRDTWSSGEDYHYGFIDDVFIYNRALSQDDVTALYNAMEPAYIPAPSAILLGGIGVGFVHRLRRRKTV